MRCPSYLVRNAGVYHFRLMIPKALRTDTGRRVIKRSLHTTDKRLAQAWALVLADRYSLIFRAVGIGGDMSGKTLEELLAHASGAKRQEWEITPTAHGYAVKTDGTEQDNASALQALALLPKSQPQALPIQALVTSSSAPPVGVSPIGIKEAFERWQPYCETHYTVRKTYEDSALPAVKEFVAWVKVNAKLHEIKSEILGNYALVLQKKNAKNTSQSKLGYIGGFFEWAKNNGYYPKGDNPARNHITITTLEKAASAHAGWQVFTMEQLKAIFAINNISKAKGGLPEKDRWIALISLYTGARSNEIARLEWMDICCVDGIWVFDFNLKGEDKSLKNTLTIRKAPIHPDLIALGLLDRVERLQNTAETKLFPELNFKPKNGPASSCQKAFLRYIARLRIKPRLGTKLGLHSFRDNVITCMEKNGVSVGWQERFVGHKVTENTATSTLNSEHKKKYTVKDAGLDVLAFECNQGIDWSARGIVDIPALKVLLK